MRDSNSEISFEMNAFYPQISGQAFEKNRGGKEYFQGREIELAFEEEEKYSGAEGNNPRREIESSEEEQKYSREGRK